MFSSKFTGRVKDSLTQYLDQKFDDYRGQVVVDLSKGLAALAGLITLLSVVIVGSVFSAATLALLLGWLLSLVWAGPTYLVSFILVNALLFGGASYLIKNKERYIEEPVFKIVSKALRSPSSSDTNTKDTVVSDNIPTIDCETKPTVTGASFTQSNTDRTLETND